MFDAAAALRLADNQIAVIRACLSDWRAKTPTPFPPESEIALIEGAVLTFDTDKGELWLEAGPDRQRMSGIDLFAFTLVLIYDRF